MILAIRAKVVPLVDSLTGDVVELVERVHPVVADPLARGQLVVLLEVGEDEGAHDGVAHDEAAQAGVREEVREERLHARLGPRHRATLGAAARPAAV